MIKNIGAAQVGISTGQTLLPYSKWLATTAAIGSSVVAYKGLSLLFNRFLHYYLIKKSHLFAARYSTAEEIEAAATFFEQLEKNSKKNPNHPLFYTLVSSAWFMGAPNMQERAAYLRELAKKRDNTN